MRGMILEIVVGLTRSTPVGSADSHPMMKLKTTMLKAQPQMSKELKQKKAKQRKQYLEELYLTQDNQHKHNSRTTVLTTTRSGRGVQSAWRDALQANSTELGEETARCQCSASITSS